VAKETANYSTVAPRTHLTSTPVLENSALIAQSRTSPAAASLNVCSPRASTAEVLESTQLTVILTVPVVPPGGVTVPLAATFPGAVSQALMVVASMMPVPGFAGVASPVVAAWVVVDDGDAPASLLCGEEQAESAEAASSTPTMHATDSFMCWLPGSFVMGKWKGEYCLGLGTLAAPNEKQEETNTGRQEADRQYGEDNTSAGQ